MDDVVKGSMPIIALHVYVNFTIMYRVTRGILQKQLPKEMVTELPAVIDNVQELYGSIPCALDDDM